VGGVNFIPCFSGLLSVIGKIDQNYSVYFFISPLHPAITIAVVKKGG